MQEQLIIGSRASKLAVKQAHMVKDALMRCHPQLSVSIHTMTTRGDSDTVKSLSQWGYKGLFTKELEDALLAGNIDIAVHSMKDMPSMLPDGLMLAAMLQRDDVRDAWISPHHPNLTTLPDGAVIGTASLRRSAQIRLLHPKAQIVPLRGNVQTRLNKLHAGDAEATFLACAGLDRLDMGDVITHRIELETMLPAVAQGAIGIECRSNDDATVQLLQPINHTPTTIAVNCERAMLSVLDGSCRTPIAGYAQINGDIIELRAQVIAPDGSAEHSVQEAASLTDAENLGRALGMQLKRIVPASWLCELS